MRDIFSIAFEVPLMILFIFKGVQHQASSNSFPLKGSFPLFAGRCKNRKGPLPSRILMLSETSPGDDGI